MVQPQSNLRIDCRLRLATAPPPVVDDLGGNYYIRDMPWEGKELTRGMEFSSYAFALCAERTSNWASSSTHHATLG